MEYELIDCGNNEKLERFGDYLLRRPDKQALFPKSLNIKEWQKADAEFMGKGRGKWKINKDIPTHWKVILGASTFELRLNTSGNSFKHIGIFPEQESNWRWIQKQKMKNLKVLNLFAYTGGSTIAALLAGAKVTHVDSSKGSIDWAKKNVELSGLSDQEVRWIVDDVRKFVEREIRRGNRYHAVIMDPPSYGKGIKGRVWDIEHDFLTLLESAMKVLHNDPSFLLINGYSAGYSHLAYKENLLGLQNKYGGEIESGELSLTAKSGAILPAGIFARWRN